MTSLFKSLMPKLTLAAFGLGIFVVGYFAQPFGSTHAQVGGAVASAISCNLSIGSIANSLGIGGGGSVPVLDDNSDTQKNIGCTWKGIAWQIAHEVLHSLTSSVVNWINSGFNGSPAFLTNPEGYFMNLGDQVAGDLIGDAGPLAKSLCTPFALNIRLGIAQGQANADNQYNNQYKCTLSTIIAAQRNSGASIGVSPTANGLTLGDILNGNIASTSYLAGNNGVLSVNGSSINTAEARTKDCLNGNFNQCGWGGFAGMMTQPQNTGGSAYIMAQDALLVQQATKATAVNNDLNRGGGFLSFQSCDNIPAAGSTATKKVCTTQTPGSYINATLAKATGASADELNLTNDLNQVVSALFSQLLSKTLSGGLYASTQSSPNYPGMGSYINQLSSDPTLQSNASVLSTQQATIIANAAAPAYAYITIENQNLSALSVTMTSYQNAEACLFAHNGNATTTDTMAIDNIIATQILPRILTTNINISTASSTIDQINAIATAIRNSPSTAQISATTAQYSAQLSALSATIDPNNAKVDQTNTNTIVKALTTTLKGYQAMCSTGTAGN